MKIIKLRADCRLTLLILCFIGSGLLVAQHPGSRFVAEVSLPTEGQVEGGLVKHRDQFFYSGTGERTAGLWATDGTTLGSVAFSNQRVSGPKVSAGQWLYYWVEDDLWATDGISPSSNQLVVEGYGLPPAWSDQRLAALGDALFELRIRGNDWELWTVDVAKRLPERVFASRRGSSSGPLGAIQVWRDQLYFFAPDPDNRFTAMWVSDGSQEGTRAAVIRITESVFTEEAGYMVSRIDGEDVLVTIDEFGGVEPVQSSETQSYRAAKGLWTDGMKVYFQAHDSTNGAELWVADGSSARRLADINPGNNSSNPEILGRVGDTLWVMARDSSGTRLRQVSLTDGSVQLLANLPEEIESHTVIELVVTEEAAYVVSKSSNDRALPVLSRLHRVKDRFVSFDDPWLTAIDAKEAGWSYLTPNDDGILFVSSQSAFGEEVFRLDTEADDPVLVKDANVTPIAGGREVLIQPVPTTLDIQYFTVTTDNQHEYVRLRPDGSTLTLRSGDTERIGWSLTSNPITGVSFFIDQQGLWSLLPGASSPGLVFDNITVRPERNAANLPFATTGSGILFLATETLGGLGNIYHSDGLVGGKTRIIVSRQVFKDQPVSFQGLSYFVNDHPTLNVQPWYTNGTNLLERFLTFSGEVTIAGATNSMLFFSGDGPGDSDGAVLWVSRGGFGVTSIGPPIAVSPLVVRPVEVDGDFYYLGRDNEGEELWMTDGTGKGTKRLTDLQSRAETGGIRNLTALDDRLFFAGFDDDHGWELWTSDGTREGTYRVTDLNEGEADSLKDTDTTIMGASGQYLYFAADDGVHGHELWRVHQSGEGVELVQDLMPGPMSSDPQNFRSIHGRLLFQANDPAHALMTLREVTEFPEFRATIEVAHDDSEIVLTFGVDSTQSYLLMMSEDLLQWRPLASYSGEAVSQSQTLRIAVDDTRAMRYFRLRAQ